MSRRNPGAAIPPSATPSQVDKSSEAVTSELTIRPFHLFALEGIIDSELDNMPLLIAERDELNQQCNLVLNEWLARHNGRFPLEPPEHTGLTIEQIRSAPGER